MSKMNDKVAVITGGDSGIRVNAVSPGPIETPIYDRMELP